MSITSTPSRRAAPDLAAHDQHPASSAMERLRPLLALAANTDLGDHEAWAAIVDVAHRVTDELVARGELPAHLRVARDDVPVLATRTIAAAWKRVAHAPVRHAGHPRGGDGRA